MCGLFTPGPSLLCRRSSHSCALHELSYTRFVSAMYPDDRAGANGRTGSVNV